MTIHQILFITICERIEPCHLFIGRFFLQPLEETRIIFLPKGTIKHTLHDYFIVDVFGFGRFHDAFFSFIDVKILSEEG